MAAAVRRQPFGSAGGRVIEEFTLVNTNGVEVRALTYGAIITSILTPDRHGTMADVVLGFSTLDPYLGPHPYFGALVGRYANRIAGGRFTIDAQLHQLSVNDGPHHLHGGASGFDKVPWTCEAHHDRNAITFAHVSRDGDQGYPGTVEVSVTYALTDNCELVIDYDARTDRTTHVNLSQHSYFNLAGEGRGDVLDHQLWIDADRYTPVDAALIPTGELAPVGGTPFDFREPLPIGARITADHRQLVHGGGYDHNWVLNARQDGSNVIARVCEPASGRTLEVATTEPGLQFYTGNSLGGTVAGKSGGVYGRHAGFCLETQHFPDAPNQPQFPSTLLRPDQRYASRTIFAFGVSR